MKGVNYRSYRHVEKLINFNDTNLKNYCEDKLKSCDQIVKFIKKKIKKEDKNWDGKICEIGSGNGKLLYRLELDKLLRKGIGFEISRSRYKFSKEFSKLIGSKKVKIFNRDFLKSKLKKNTFDLIIGVDIIFNLISANSKSHQLLFLNLCRKYLKKNGALLLEVMSFKNEINLLKKKNSYTKTFLFGKSDPYKNVKAKYKLIDQNIYIKKFFLHKNGSNSFFSNLVKPIDYNFWSKLQEWNVEISKEWNNIIKSKEDEYMVILRKK